MPLAPHITIQAFDNWVVDFFGPISTPGKRNGTHYIIKAIDYLTRWAEAAPVKYCTTATAKKFLFENMETIFCYLKILLKSDQGTHFLNKLIDEIIAKFQIQHSKTTPYHP